MENARLIDANARVKAFWKGVEDGDIASFENTEDLIFSAPTIDPESLRPTGRKERSAISETGLMCTNCYSDVDLDAVFCKYCGAKMEV